MILIVRVQLFEGFVCTGIYRVCVCVCNTGYLLYQYIRATSSTVTIKTWQPADGMVASARMNCNCELLVTHCAAIQRRAEMANSTIIRIALIADYFALLRVVAPYWLGL